MSSIKNYLIIVTKCFCQKKKIDRLSILLCKLIKKKDQRN
jgi:hypothetical protein